MSMVVMVSCGILIPVIGLLIYLLYLHLQEKKRRRIWGEYGRMMGLNNFPDRQPGLRGEYEGHELELAKLQEVSYSSEGSSTITYTHFGMVMNLREGFTTKIELDPGFTGFRKLAGIRYTKIGDKKFDAKYSITCEDEAILGMVITDIARRRLMDLKMWGFRWEGMHAVASKRGLVFDTNELMRIPELLLEVVLQIEKLEQYEPEHFHSGENHDC